MKLEALSRPKVGTRLKENGPFAQARACIHVFLGEHTKLVLNPWTVCKYQHLQAKLLSFGLTWGEQWFPIDQHLSCGPLLTNCL